MPPAGMAVLSTNTPVSTPSSSPQVSEESRTSYSYTLSTLIVLGSVFFYITYLCFLVVTFRYARNHPRAVNKQSGIRLQRFAPAIYIFIVTSSLVELSLASWLLIQYFYLANSPNAQALTAAKLLLFCACWTAVTGGAYSVLFLHPRWTELPVASIGAQSIWVFVTWISWIVGAGLLNGAVPQLLVHAKCASLVYCGQIQGLFGGCLLYRVIFFGLIINGIPYVAIAVLEATTLTAGMIVLLGLACGSTLDMRLPQFRMPQVHMPQFHMPQIRTPHFRMPQFRMPQVRMPQAQHGSAVH